MLKSHHPPGHMPSAQSAAAIDAANFGHVSSAMNTCTCTAAGRALSPP